MCTHKLKIHDFKCPWKCSFTENIEISFSCPHFLFFFTVTFFQCLILSESVTFFQLYMLNHSTLPFILLKRRCKLLQASSILEMGLISNKKLLNKSYNLIPAPNCFILHVLLTTYCQTSIYKTARFYLYCHIQYKLGLTNVDSWTLSGWQWTYTACYWGILHPTNKHKTHVTDITLYSWIYQKTDRKYTFRH